VIIYSVNVDSGKNNSTEGTKELVFVIFMISLLVKMQHDPQLIFSLSFLF
jgi:hypothetical protein